MPIVKIQPEDMALAEEFAHNAMRDQTDRSRAVAFRGNITFDVWLNGKACEIAAARYFGLTPRKVLHFDTKRGGDETDLKAVGKNFDVKGSPNPKAKLLIYSCEITHLYDEKNFDALMFVRACATPLTYELVGWVTKLRFRQEKWIAPHGIAASFRTPLERGTWYMHQDMLEKISTLPRTPHEHFCHCGKWGSFGHFVNLRAGQEGQWFCNEHNPKQQGETA